MEDRDRPKEDLIAELSRLRKRVADQERSERALLLAQRELERERDRARRYLDVAGVMFIVINADQTVGLVNRKGCKVLGYEEPEIIGVNWFDTFVPERIREGVRAVFEKLMCGETVPVEYFENPVLTKEGEERLVSWHNTVLSDEEGRITGTLSSGEDITERARIQRERDNLIDELQNALAEVKALKMMVPICAFDKRNPSDAIREHYEQMAREKRCAACLKILRR